jgi:hypothetical protein
MQTFSLASAVTPKSFNAESRTFQVMFYSGATVPRYDFWKDEEYDLRFEVSDKAVDLSRLKAGAPFLRDHYSSLQDTLGVVEDAWLKGGKGYARIRMSDREDVRGIAQDIEAGIIRNVSMGAAVLEETITRDDTTKRKLITANRWLPMEISAVAIPADHQAQVLSNDLSTQLAGAARKYIDQCLESQLSRLTDMVEARVRLAIQTGGR